jgi:hypothetical protein
MDLQEKNKKSLKDFKKWLKRKKDEQGKVCFLKDEEIMEICNRQYVRFKSFAMSHTFSSAN